MQLLENIYKPINKVQPKFRAAMLYKTEPFYSDVSNYQHTNNWEILASIQILNNNGFIVDLIDRTNNNWKPNHKYDLFMGLGVGNSGRNFVKYAKLAGAKVNVLLAMGPETNITNQRVIERYELFKKRTGLYAEPMRTALEITPEKLNDIMNTTDIILAIGEQNTKSYDSFIKYNKPILTFMPGVSNKVSYSNDWLNTRNINEFLCFSGHGLICKGVDIVTEAFFSMPNKKLNICGPMESAYSKQYMQKIQQTKNIKYHGFIEPGGSKFNELAASCSYVIFHSATEGFCTSVATAMRAGLVPVINPWTSININDCGIQLSDDSDYISNIIETVTTKTEMTKIEYEKLVKSTIMKSQNFSQAGFIDTYSRSFDIIKSYL